MLSVFPRGETNGTTRPLRITRLTISGILLFSLLTVSASAAKLNCDETRTKKGEASYQKCLFDEQEKSVKDQVAAYKTTLDKQKQIVKDFYAAQINEENFAWQDILLRMSAEESDRNADIKELEKNKEQAEELQRQKNAQSTLKKIKSLTQSSHTQKLKRFKLRQDAELHELDVALTSYELQLRQQAIPSL